MRVSQTGLDQADRSVDRSETGLLGCVCVHAGVSDRSRPGRPVCRPVYLGVYVCLRVSQTGLLGCARIRAYVSDRGRPVCLLVLVGKL